MFIAGFIITRLGFLVVWLILGPIINLGVRAQMINLICQFYTPEEKECRQYPQQDIEKGCLKDHGQSGPGTSYSQQEEYQHGKL